MSVNVSLYTDKKYISLLSHKLDRFQQKSEYLWNFRCPHCGDSLKNKFKARGYVYKKKNNLFYSCKNCNESSSFGNFLKTIDRPLYDQYQLESFSETVVDRKQPDYSMVRVAPVFDKTKKIKLPKISDLPEEHFARQYVASRKLPRWVYDDLYFTSDYKAFVFEMLPDCDKKMFDNENRIVIPFYSVDGILSGWSGRSLDEKSKAKYMTFKLYEDAPKVFGANRVDISKKIYVVEGPIDSYFLDNCIASMDSALDKVIHTFGNYDYVFVFDNEPRNPDICRVMKKVISFGKNICIWPKSIKEKDINEMILSGLTAPQIQSIIDTSTVCELQAQLEFDQWRKV